MRPCTTATAAVCEAFEKGSDANVEQMVGLLQESSRVHGELTKNAAMGEYRNVTSQNFMTEAPISLSSLMGFISSSG